MFHKRVYRVCLDVQSHDILPYYVHVDFGRRSVHTMLEATARLSLGLLLLCRSAASKQKLCCAHGWCLAGTSPLCWHARVRASQAVQPTLSMRLSQDVERNYSRGRRKRYYCLPRPKASMLTSMRQLQAPRAKSYLEKAAYRRPQGLCAVRHRRSLGIDAARPSTSREAHASAWPAGGVRGRPIWSSGCNPNPVRVRVRAALVASDSPCVN